jgi:hypothetical protein
MPRGAAVATLEFMTRRQGAGATWGYLMRKSRAVRVAGFVGALGASAALVGFAASGTGAYFTDSHSGTIQASTGSVKVITNPGDNGVLNFANLLPGEYQTQQIQYTAAGTGSEDIWLVFPTTDNTPGENPSEAFTGTPADPDPGPLGRYGHLAVSSPTGSFTSYNLATAGTGSHSGPTCDTDANGHGGSNQQLTDPNDRTLPFCSPIKPILLSSGLTYGEGAAATITFGYTPLDKGSQASNVAYKIVATQHGINPNNQFN